VAETGFWSRNWAGRDPTTTSSRSLYGACVVVALACCCFGQQALGQGGNFDGFGNLIEGQAVERAMTAPAQRGRGAADPWGPVPTDKLSLANAAPVLLPFFNNGPVFGLPGTVADAGFWNNTQLSGDWGGRRTELARNGYFFDVYTTSAYQDLMSGGLDPGDWFVQNTQMCVNIDTGRAGWWDGGLIHFTTQARYGGTPEQTFNSGASVPVYTGLLEPDPLAYSTMLPSEYFLVQGLTEHTSFLVGKISDVYIPDQTLFGDSYKFYFANFAFNKNPITTNFYNPTAWAVLGIWAPTKQLAFAGGVLDPNSRSQNLATNAFDRVNLYFTAVASYDIAGLPGQFSPAFNWSNQHQLDLANPFGALTPGQIPQAIGALLGSPDTAGLPINNYDDSCFLIANASQYLYVADRPREVAAKLKSGQPLRGVGVFGRAGWAPQRTNTITGDGSVALFARGLAESRSYDSAGIGWYMNGISPDLVDQVRTYSGGLINVKNEQGVEVFYDYAITPAIRLIPSYQHIWNPLSAVAAGRTDADLWMMRGTIVF
jgi:porin